MNCCLVTNRSHQIINVSRCKIIQNLLIRIESQQNHEVKSIIIIYIRSFKLIILLALLFISLYNILNFNFYCFISLDDLSTNKL